MYSILCAHKKRGKQERKQGAGAKCPVTFCSIVDKAEAVHGVDGGNLRQRQWKNSAFNSNSSVVAVILALRVPNKFNPHFSFPIYDSIRQYYSFAPPP